MVRKTLVAIATACVALALSVTASLAYYGGWSYDNNRGGWEVLRLGDGSDGTYLHLSGTEDWCGSPGSSYQRVRNVLHRQGGEVSWWIDADCGQVVRICIEPDSGATTCSSYWLEGWRDWY